MNPEKLSHLSICSLFSKACGFYCAVFGVIERLTKGWFISLSARFVFFAVLFFYYMNSFFSKVGNGFWGFFQIQDGAYYQIAPRAIEAAGGDSAGVSLLTHLIVFSGSYMEFILPLLIVAGLLTRVSSLGMIGFILVQTYVDIAQHEVDGRTIGALFDRLSDSVISDQRTLWIFALAVLVVKGGGYFSLDHLFCRIFCRKCSNQI